MSRRVPERPLPESRRAPRPAGHRPKRPKDAVGAHKGVQWAEIEQCWWQLTNAALGKRLGVSPSLVSRQRRRLGQPLPPAPQPMPVDELFARAGAADHVTLADVRAVLGGNTRDAQRWVRIMREAGAIEAVGVTRARRYRRAESLD